VLSGAAAAGLALLSLGAACMLVTRETRKEVRALEAASEALRKAEAEPEGPEMRARRARFFAETPIAVCRGRLEQARDAVAVTWPAFAAAQLASREHPMFRTVTMELWGDTESGADFSVSAEISERLGDEVKDWAPYRYRKGERRVRYRPERARVVALYPRWEGEITVNGPVAPEQSELVVGVFELAIDDCAKQLLTLPSPFEPPRR
jgi:hypothetical protein